MSSKTENARVDLYINTKGAEASLKELSKDAATLRRELKSLSPASQEFADKSKQLQQVSGRLEEVNLKLKGTTKGWEFMKNQMSQWGTAALAIFGTQALFSGINNLIDRSAKLSDQFADIRKTTGLSEAGVKSLNKELSSFNTRTATSDLREMAIVAGQLGYNSEKEVLKFVGAMDKLKVALGDEFGNNAELISRELGGLRGVFTDIKTAEADKDLMKIGNAINELSAAGSATAPVVADFSNRIGGMGINLGLSSAEVLGMSAALQELNVPAERGGTAVVRILQKMTNETKAFANIAGMSIKEYENLLNTNLYGAFTRVIQKSQEGGKSTTQFAAMMQDAELKAAGASEVFSKLGRNTGLLAEKVDLARESLKNTNSVMNEFSIKNDNFAAKLEKLQKWIAGIFVNPTITRGMEMMIGFISDLVTPTESLAEAARKENYELVKATSTIMSLNVGNKQRSDMIRDLQGQYPKFLENLSAEKVTNEELHKALAQVNNEMIKKMALATKMDAIMEQAKETAEAQVEATEAEILLQKRLLSVQDENIRARKLRDDLQKSGTSIADQASVTLLSLEEQGLSRMNNKVVNLQEAYEEYAKTLTKLNIEKQKSNELDKELENFKNLLGIKDESTPEGRKKKNIGGSAISDEDKKKAEKDFEDAAKAYDDYLNGLAKLDAEYRTLKTKLIDDDLNRALKTNADKYVTEKFQTEKALQDELVLVEKAHSQGIISDDTYNLELADINKRGDKLKIAQEESYVKESDKIYQGFAAKQKADYQKDTEENTKLLEERNAKALEVQNQLNLALQDAKIIEAQGEQDPELEMQLQIDKLTMQRDIELQNEKLTADEKLLIQQNYENSLNQLRNNRAEKERQLGQQIANAAINFTQQAVNAGFQIEAQNRETNLNAQIGSLERERQAALANKNLTEEQKAAINQKFDAKERELKRENWKAQQEAAIAMAVINGALAIVQSMASNLLPYPASLVAPITVGALTALQVGVIASAKPPAFAEGGNTFASGGNITQPTMGLIGEAGPEWVAPNWMIKSPVYGPNIKALEQVRQGNSRVFADGGSTGEQISNKDTNRSLGQVLWDHESAIGNLIKSVNDLVNYQRESKVINVLTDTESDNKKFENRKRIINNL